MAQGHDTVEASNGQSGKVSDTKMNLQGCTSDQSSCLVVLKDYLSYDNDVDDEHGHTCCL